MKSVEKQCAETIKNMQSERSKWMCTPRLKDMIPLPEGWLDYFFKTVNFVAETGCIEKQCKIANCQKTYKGSNGTTSNFAKHVRKNHPVALKRYAEQNPPSNHHRTSERNNVDPGVKRVACESNLTDLKQSSDPQITTVNSEIELDSDLSDGAYEIENEIVHADGIRFEEELQQSVTPLLSQANPALTKKNFVNVAANSPKNLNTTAISGPFAAGVRNVNLNCTIAPTYRKRKVTTTEGPTTSRLTYQYDAGDSVSDGDELDHKHVTKQRSTKVCTGSSQKCVSASGGQTQLAAATSIRIKSMAADSPHQHSVSSNRLVRFAADLARMTCERERDEMVAFGNLVVSEMRCVTDDRTRDSLKIKIMSLIYETKYSVMPPNVALNSSAAASCSSQSTPTGAGSMHHQSNELHFGLDTASYCNNYL